jgi:hypothetical protein
VAALPRNDRRYVFTPPFKARIVSVQGAFGKAHILSRDLFARRRRPPTLVGSKVLSKFMIFNVNSMIRNFFLLMMDFSVTLKILLKKQEARVL